MSESLLERDRDGFRMEKLEATPQFFIGIPDTDPKVEALILTVDARPANAGGANSFQDIHFKLVSQFEMDPHAIESLIMNLHRQARLSTETAQHCIQFMLNKHEKNGALRRQCLDDLRTLERDRTNEGRFLIRGALRQSKNLDEIYCFLTNDYRLEPTQIYVMVVDDILYGNIQPDEAEKILAVIIAHNRQKTEFVEDIRDFVRDMRSGAITSIDQFSENV